MSYTKELYTNYINDLSLKSNYGNSMNFPRLQKVTIGVGIKALDSDSKFISYMFNQVYIISGQKPVITRSKKSIASFKLRENIPIGCMVTLRNKNMYHFLDKLIYIALPRVRDFRGLSQKGFNQSGHYSFGLNDHSSFLEVDLDNIEKIFGMNITIATTSKQKTDSMNLLKKINLPIK